MSEYTILRIITKRVDVILRIQGIGPIAEIKQHQDAKLFVMTHHNRDTMIKQILEDL